MQEEEETMMVFDLVERQDGRRWDLEQRPRNAVVWPWHCPDTLDSGL